MRRSSGGGRRLSISFILACWEFLSLPAEALAKAGWIFAVVVTAKGF
jgi:hypothetical protein